MADELARVLRVLARSQLGDDSLLSKWEAAALLPMDPDQAQAWLENVPSVDSSSVGIPLYRWGDITAALSRRYSSESKAEAAWLTSDEAAAYLGVSRSTFDRMLKERSGPTGESVKIGTGKQRKHVRWHRDALDAWFEAPESLRAVAAKRRRTRASDERPPSLLALAKGDK